MELDTTLQPETNFEALKMLVEILPQLTLEDAIVITNKVFSCVPKPVQVQNEKNDDGIVYVQI